MKTAGWDVGKIAKETGVHSQTVRRCLTLAESDSQVQKLAESGKVGTVAALELAKLDGDTRKGVIAALDAENEGKKGATTYTEDAIRAKAKEIARGNESATTATDTGKRHTRAKGGARAAQLITWRGSKAKSEVLGQLAFQFSTMSEDPEQQGTASWYELRGALGLILYLRTDLNDATLPPPLDDNTSIAEKKILVLFDKLVASQAKQWAKANKDKQAQVDSGAPAEGEPVAAAEPAEGEPAAAEGNG
jgi:hypothetical protein